MPIVPKSPVKSPLRYCVSCVATLAYWALWLVLGSALGIQLYIAANREVPVPDFVLRRIEAQLAAANLEVKFGRVRCEPSGRLLLEDVQLRSRMFDDPLVVSRMVYVRKTLWSVLLGLPLPDEIRVEGATLQLPAILSPSGATEPLIREVGGALHYEHGAWQITQLAGLAGPVRVSVHGAFVADRRPGTTTVKLEEITGRYLRAAKRLALELPRLQALDQPALDLEFGAMGPGLTEVHLRFTTQAVSSPSGLPLDLGPTAATGDWLWSGGRPRPLRLRAETERLALDERLAADRIRVRAEVQPEADLSGIREVRAQLAAVSVTALGERLDRPVLTAALSVHDQAVRGDCAFQAYGEPLAAAARADLGRRTAELDFEGRVPPGLVTGLLGRYRPKLEPYFRFGDPVAVHGSARFLPGWQFDRLSSRVLGGRLDSHGVHVTLARGQIDVDSAGNFLAHDALAAIGENFARGSYWMNFRTMDYRMLLVGRLRPPEISGWFRGPWWPEFWSNFSFQATPPQADVDVRGCWRNASQASYYGSTDAEGATVLGADFEKAHVVVFARPQFDHVLELHATRAGGAQALDGWFKRFADPAAHHTVALEFDGTGNLDPALYARVGGARAAALLGGWEFARPPHVHAWGRADFPASGAMSPNLQFDGRTDGGPVSYTGLPIDQLSVKGGLSGADLRLDRIDFGLAGGKGSAKAALGGPAGARWIGFDAYLKEADLARAIRAAESFNASRNGTTPPLAASPFIKRAQGGKLDLAVSGQADPANPTGLRGNGNVQITGTELGEIHLFGLLSQVLSAVWLNFSSLKLDSARSSFTIGDGRVHFPDVKITGPSAVIDARGNYHIAAKTLDFTARLKPFEESRNPLTQVVGIVITPLASIFELKLSGPLAKPSWSVTLGSSGEEKAAPPAKPDAPAPPPAAAGAKP